MEIQIKLSEHQYKTLNDWCVANSIDTQEYLGKKVWEAFLVDKYGDLNDKVPKVVDKTDKKKPEGVIMAPYELQLENVVTITTPKEINDERYMNKEVECKFYEKFNGSESSKTEEKKEATPKTPKKIPLTPVK